MKVDYDIVNDERHNRLVIIDHRGKAPTRGRVLDEYADVRVVRQDNGRTLKVFLYDE